MKITQFQAVAILSYIAGTAAQNGDFTCSCDGLRAPRWQDCDKIIDGIDSEGFTAPNPGFCNFLNPPAGTNADNLNCVIQYCSREGVAGGTPINSGDIKIGYSTVGAACRSTDGEPGGTCSPAEGVSTDQYPVTVNAYVNKEYVEPKARLMRNISETSTEKGATTQRIHARDLTRRQSPPDSDTEFQLFTTSTNVPQPGVRKQVFGPVPDGAVYMVGTERSESNSVGSSVTAGASFFELFSAEVSVSVDFTQTFSESEGFSLPVNCGSGKRGVVFWEPRYTRYSGLYLPSRTQVDWYIANDGPQTSYALTCID